MGGKVIGIERSRFRSEGGVGAARTACVGGKSRTPKPLMYLPEVSVIRSIHRQFFVHGLSVRRIGRFHDLPEIVVEAVIRMAAQGDVPMAGACTGRAA